MKISARQAVAFAIIVLVAGPAGWCYVPWRKWRYDGPGQISDWGVISYPRFQIRFPSLPLNTMSTRSFTFTGAPVSGMRLQLYVEGGDLQRAQLERADVEISASITDDNLRRPVCQASGSPRTSVSDSGWILMSGSDTAAFWHAACLHPELSPRHRYTLTVAVRPRRADLPPLRLVPTLEGGGIELP